MSRLVTIPVSHFCEKARWALDLAGAPYAEDGYPPVWHRLALAPLRATTAPVLVTDDGRVLRESTEILRHADEVGGLGLFGASAAQRAEIEKLVARFDRHVGPPARLLAYAELLDEPEPFLGAAGAGLEGARAKALTASRPLVAGAIRRYFRVGDARITEAKARLETEAAFADELRGDGKYLVNGGFSAADLTFAALLAPMVHPEGYGAPVPPVDEMPAAYQAVIERWRATPSGSAVRELYAAHRHAAAQPVPAG